MPAAKIVPQDNHVDYRRGDLIEWYQNDESGLEQGFTLLARPVTSKSKVRLWETSTITLEFALSSDLATVLSEGGDAMDFITAEGVHVLRYGDLLANDSTDRKLAAQFRLNPSSLSTNIDILIDAEQAIYPITVGGSHAHHPLLVD